MKVTITLEGDEAARFMAEHERWGSFITADVDQGWEYLAIHVSDSQITVDDVPLPGGCRACPATCGDCLKTPDCECYIHGGKVGSASEIIVEYLQNRENPDPLYHPEYLAEKIVRIVT